MMRVVPVIDMSIPSMRPVIPGAGPDEHPANKPIRPIVAIGSAIVGSIVKVAIRANRRHPDIDRDLRTRA